MLKDYKFSCKKAYIEFLYLPAFICLSKMIVNIIFKIMHKFMNYL
ncbi:hypothetical protein GCWU000282_01195 [Catonella morbi ATCC 51271]|uniref:Uncharacterized protein n=1 Tax=Catonella morbi ATCC 51271 TaxID=592026 RepID=V2XMS0_9FIRM|nr:hypothetical protein GCWU000282_01195 [Catonella morbi ATCC 51271]